MKSIVSYPDRGSYGKSSYRGNCSGRLIEDLIKTYKLDNLYDYAVGGGTTEDVVNAMGIEGNFYDLNRGFNLLTDDLPERPGNVFYHPAYWSIVDYRQYNPDKDIADKYDLSRPQSWENFVKELNYTVVKQFAALEKGGRMFVLMGDIKKRGNLYSMLSAIAKPGTLEQIIIKEQWNCVSDSRTYAGSFVPIVHEYLMVVKKESDLIIPVHYETLTFSDMRDIKSSTWRDIVVAVMRDKLGSMASLEQIYEQLKGHKRAEINPNYQAKIRQVVQDERYFTRIGRGVYRLAC